MNIENFLNNWKTDTGHTLTREDLKEGEIYLCTLFNGEEVLVNKCVCSVIKGRLYFTNEVFWERMHFSGGFLNKKNYKKSSIPCGTNVPCFKKIGQLEESGGFKNNKKETKNLIITKDSSGYNVLYKKTRDKWFMDRDGNGDIPEKYWDKPLENEAFKAIGVLY